MSQNIDPSSLISSKNISAETSSNFDGVELKNNYKNSFNNGDIVLSIGNNLSNASSKFIQLNRLGFQLDKKYNDDISIICDKGSSIDILMSNFFSECDYRIYNFNGNIPVFIEKSTEIRDSNLVTSSSIFVNGLKSDTIVLLYGNYYKLYIPKFFGNVKIDDSLGLVTYQIEEKDFYFEILISVKFLKNGFVSFTFSKCPLLNLRARCFSFENIQSVKTNMSHPLSFYSFEIFDDNWYIYSPLDLTVDKKDKTNYNYFLSFGDTKSYYINGHENPILIFDYDKNYKIKNNNKDSEPFYFDATAQGGFRLPYKDFENDINTFRDVLRVNFSTDIEKVKINLDPFIITRGNLGNLNLVDSWEDPYEVLSEVGMSSPAYDPDSMFYASANSDYFGNKIIIGKRRIESVLGTYGLKSPNSKKFTFNEARDYYIFDSFNHMSGRYFHVSCLDRKNLPNPDKKTLSYMGITENNQKFLSNNYSEYKISLIGDIFVNLNSMVNAMIKYKGLEIKPHSYNSVIIVPIGILNFNTDIGKSALKEFSIVYKNYGFNDNADEGKFIEYFKSLINNLIKDLRAKTLKEIGVEFI